MYPYVMQNKTQSYYFPICKAFYQRGLAAAAGEGSGIVMYTGSEKRPALRLGIQGEFWQSETFIQKKNRASKECVSRAGLGLLVARLPWRQHW